MEEKKLEDWTLGELLNYDETGIKQLARWLLDDLHHHEERKEIMEKVKAQRSHRE